ncbi:MAG TPA: hypothetical protein DCS66_22815 [Flavobacteriaceae bacterium]|nr:hypothetical protein [Flavobacteriaceae bacterium]
MSDEFKTIDARRATERFGFSRQFFYDLLNNKENKVREYRVGKRRFANLDDIIAFIQSKEK